MFDSFYHFYQWLRSNHTPIPTSPSADPIAAELEQVRLKRMAATPIADWEEEALMPRFVGWLIFPATPDRSAFAKGLHFAPSEESLRKLARQGVNYQTKKPDLPNKPSYI